MRVNTAALVLVMLVLTAKQGPAATNSTQKLCGVTVGILATEFEYRVPNTKLGRVEIRQCDPGFAESIQIAAWARGESGPAFIIDAASNGVVQLAASGPVFLIETASATTDRVYVIVFKAGTPRLVLKRNTKAQASFSVTAGRVSISVPNYWRNTVDRFSFTTR